MKTSEIPGLKLTISELQQTLESLHDRHPHALDVILRDMELNYEMAMERLQWGMNAITASAAAHR